MSDIQKSSTVNAGLRTGAISKNSKKTVAGVSGLVVSGGLALLSVFSLATWAELSPLHHGVQHVLLFSGGVGIGASLVGLLKRGGKH